MVSGPRIRVLGVGAGVEGAAHLDVSLRGAVSIARRLQDPLAELVRIEPKAIGVGNTSTISIRPSSRNARRRRRGLRQRGRRRWNTASRRLARISGLNESLAKNIVAFEMSTARSGTAVTA
jgi:uncharacterized protein